MKKILLTFALVAASQSARAASFEWTGVDALHLYKMFESSYEFSDQPFIIKSENGYRVEDGNEFVECTSETVISCLWDIQISYSTTGYFGLANQRLNTLLYVLMSQSFDSKIVSRKYLSKIDYSFYLLRDEKLTSSIWCYRSQVQSHKFVCDIFNKN